jgi:hypothetical protein
MAASEIVLRLAWRGISGGWNALLKEVIPTLTAPLGRLRNPRQIVEAWPGGVIPLGPDVALFAHFDRAGAVRPHILRYLVALGEAGLSVVVVSNAGRLQADAMAALQAVCAGVIVRRNVGYDFGAWGDGLRHLGLPRAETRGVTLVNDSVYGPFAPLTPIIRRFDPAHADAWGLTDSWQRRYHLQSYFLWFGRAVLDSAAWRQFWANLRPLPSKHAIVRRYEIGLTQALLKAGLRCRAVWPYQALLATVGADVSWSREKDDEMPPPARLRQRQVRRVLEAAGYRSPLNPTSDLWRQLIEAKYPFIKRELLRDNPTRVADLAEWRGLVAAGFGSDIDPIDRDLERTLRHRTP